MKAMKALERAFQQAGPTDVPLYLVDIGAPDTAEWDAWGVRRDVLDSNGKVLRTLSDYSESEASGFPALITRSGEA